MIENSIRLTSTSSEYPAMCMAVGKVSLLDWLLLTSSLGANTYMPYTGYSGEWRRILGEKGI